MIVCMDTAGVDCRDGGQRAPQAVMCLGGMVGPQMLVGRRPVIMVQGLQFSDVTVLSLVVDWYFLVSARPLCGDHPDICGTREAMGCPAKNPRPPTVL